MNIALLILGNLAIIGFGFGLMYCTLKLLFWVITKMENRPKKRKVVRHHDNQPYSHYNISSRNLRETRKERYGL